MTTISVYLDHSKLTSAEAETRCWLNDSGMSTAFIVLDPEGGYGPWDARLTVSLPEVGDLSPRELESTLAYRLWMADDIRARTTADLADYRNRCERSLEIQQQIRPVITYDDFGFRCDVPSVVRARIRMAVPQSCGDHDDVDGAPDFVGPRIGARYSVTETGAMTARRPAGMERAHAQALDWAAGSLGMSNAARLWSHRALPEEPGALISARDDDGWAATEDPAVIWHVTGLDCRPPYLNSYTTHRLDEVLGWAIDVWESRLVLSARNCLLHRESPLAFHLDYEPADLNPGRDFHAGVGAFTGWVLGCRSRPTVRPFDNNSAEFRDDLPTIRRVFDTLGDNRLQWAIAHDDIVHGLRESDLDSELRRFIGLLINDLILVRAGHVAVPRRGSRRNPVQAVPAEAPRARTEFVLTGVTLLHARETVDQFAQTVTQPLEARVSKAARRRDPDRYPPGAILVEVETLADPQSFATLTALATLIGTEGHWSEWRSDDTRIVPIG